MYPFLFEIGSFRLPTFGLMVALGFLAALWVLQRELPRKGFDAELGSSIITAGMIGGLVGAKLYFVLFEMPGATWKETFAALFSGSGLTWYGGFAVAAIAIYAIIKKRGVPFLPIADAAGMALAIGYAIGRIGCQLAGDGDYGVPTDLPWGMAYPDGVVPTLEKVHPAPVYETLLGLATFALLWQLRTRLQIPGQLFSLYLVLAGAARFAVEIIRLNPDVLWGLSAAQLISLVMIAAGIGLGIRLWRIGANHDSPLQGTPL
ncbi:MAG: prolipoprotein diacylglyceryl transferase [Candidatus Latescibacteria bacterium]|nr:prolipoprotein diacylglyceryl transferase [Candidatus Latescibacterota bacterium]